MWQHTRSTQKKVNSPLYTNDKETEKEIKEASPFIIARNNIKYLGVILTKIVKDLYDKNFKSLKKISENVKMSHDLG